ncbi:MAG: D-aminoacyl-tRNA deacylase [Roseburia sp.]|nr:D-aminoacyl-tRNA deacylase [Anaeroplasma bactoclasticum]MCM1196182.1 D-aminoacyl-tRNA deacylase [Roseburia sp.]MCM1556270.1 D-aminoacyl-tRNA deacylase [Anaeroplasma bactoclasticum]
MRVIVQRAKDAKCVVNHSITGQIKKGYMLLVGFTHTDTRKEVECLAKKIIGLRIFEDEAGKLNKSILDVSGAILAISQFTLYADAKKGNRPSFTEAMHYDQANALFLQFIEVLKSYGVVVETGVFGASMQIEFTNVGPTTIILDSINLM